MARNHLAALAALALLGGVAAPSTGAQGQPAAGGPIPVGACNGRSLFTFSLPRHSGPQSLGTENGRLYFPMGFGNNRIGRMDLAGNITTASPADANRSFGQIVGFPGQNVLFLAQPDTNRIGSVLDNGSFVDQDGGSFNLLPTPNSAPSFVTIGPDGNLWFTETNADQVGRIGITTATGVTEISPLAGGRLSGIAPGPDGNLYVADSQAHVLWTVHPATSSITLTSPNLRDGGDPFSVALGPDSGIWFTEPNLHRIGRMGTNGVVEFFSLPNGQNEVPEMITAGSDGALWFSERVGDSDYIGRITTAGVVTHCAVPNGLNPAHLAFDGITVGPDGNMWFAGQAHDQLVQVVIPDNVREGVNADFSGPQSCKLVNASMFHCASSATVSLRVAMPPNQPAKRSVTFQGFGADFTIRGASISKVSYVDWRTPMAQIQITGRIAQANAPFQPGDRVAITLATLPAGGVSSLVVTRGNFNVLTVGFQPNTQHTIIIR